MHVRLHLVCPVAQIRSSATLAAYMYCVDACLSPQSSKCMCMPSWCSLTVSVHPYLSVAQEQLASTLVLVLVPVGLLIDHTPISWCLNLVCSLQLPSASFHLFNTKCSCPALQVEGPRPPARHSCVAVSFRDQCLVRMVHTAAAASSQPLQRRFACWDN